MNELKIEYIAPENLTPYENNTRKHAPEDIESIKKSILDVGFLDPIGIWGECKLSTMIALLDTVDCELKIVSK